MTFQLEHYRLLTDVGKVVVLLISLLPMAAVIYGATFLIRRTTVFIVLAALPFGFVLMIVTAITLFLHPPAFLSVDDTRRVEMTAVVVERYYDVDYMHSGGKGDSLGFYVRVGGVPQRCVIDYDPPKGDTQTGRLLCNGVEPPRRAR